MEGTLLGADSAAELCPDSFTFVIKALSECFGNVMIVVFART